MQPRDDGLDVGAARLVEQVDLVDEQQADAASERVAGGGNAPATREDLELLGSSEEDGCVRELLRLLYVNRGGGDYAARQGPCRR